MRRTFLFTLLVGLLIGITSLAEAQPVQLGSDIDGEAAGDESGICVSLSTDGNIVAIGAHLNDGNGTNSGSARVYEWNSGTASWVQLGSDIDGEVAGDSFGYSVSLSSDGNIVAIGAPDNSGTRFGGGHTRVYEWNSGTASWVQLGSDINGEVTNDQSGISVSLSADGSHVAIGAHRNAANGYNSGQARVYEWNSGTASWVQLGADLDGEAAWDYYGVSTSLSEDGNIVAIGGRANDGNGTDSGHVRVFEWNSGTASWDQLGADIDGEAAGDQAGHSVSISADGNLVAIGSPMNDGNGGDSGHTRVYEWNGSIWTQLGIDIDGEAAGDYSGYRVSLSGDGNILAAGAIFNDDSGTDAGHVRIFEWNGSSWAQIGSDIDAEAAGDRFGTTVSLSDNGSQCGIGAVRNDGNGSDSGHARIFQCYPPPTEKWVDQATGSDANDGDTEGYPYATLQHAINNSNSGTGAGDRSYIHVKDGSYETIGQTNFGGSTTAILIQNLDYLTIQAVSGHDPKVMPGTAASIVSISVENCDYLIVDNIDSDQTTAQFDNWHVWDSNDLTVRNCTFEGGEDGIDFNTAIVTALIEDNTFMNITTGNGDEVLDFTDGAVTDVIIQDNLFDYNYRHITVSGVTSNLIIRRNIMDGTNSEEAIRLIGVSEILVENNVIMNNLQQGIYVDNGCSDITIQHNTFFNNDQEAGPNGELRIRPDPVANNITVKNNIIYGNGSNPAFESATGWAGEDYNLIYNTTDIGTFTFGSNNITGIDPMFVSTAAGSEDLHLQDASIAIGAGANLGVTEDVEGNVRGSTPDIGAYENSFDTPQITEVWVDPTYCDGCPNDGHTWGYDAFNSIQAGIDAVTGSTVNVAAGIYYGSVTVAKSVNLIGATGAELIPGAGNVGFDLSADNITIQGFTIHNCQQGILGYLDSSDYGANFGYSNLQLLDNTIYDVSNGAWGFAIYLGTESERYNPADPIGIYDPSLTSLLDFTGLVISGNEIYNTSGAAITLQSMEALTGTLDFLDNNVYNSSASGLWIDSAQDINVSGNKLTSNSNGVFLSSYADGYYEGTPDGTYDPRDIDISANEISGNSSKGVALYDGWPGFISINDNTLTGNIGSGVYNYLASEVDASYNWWGAADGPSGFGPGTGDSVSDHVDFTPWLTAPYTVDQTASATHIAVEENGIQTPEHDPIQNRTTITYDLSAAGVPDYFAWDVHVTYPVANLTPLSVARLQPSGGSDFFYSNVGNSPNGTLQVSYALAGGESTSDYTGDIFSVVFDGILENLTAAVTISYVRVRERPNDPVTPIGIGAALTIQVDDSVPTLVVTNPAETCVNSEQTFTFDGEDNVDLYRIQYQFDSDGWNDAVPADITGATYTTPDWTTTTLTSLSEGSHTIYFRSWDDVGYVSSESSWTFWLDTLAPTAVTDLEATPEHVEINLTWTVATQHDGYYLYRDKRVTYPYFGGLTIEGGWPGTYIQIADITDETATSYQDLDFADASDAHRAVYDYKIVPYDCVNAEAAVSNTASATNYFLGDVAANDGVIFSGDLGLFSTAYGTVSQNGSTDEIDFGPTSDWSSYGLPNPDGLIDFEDLIIFAMNYGIAGPTIPITGFDEQRDKSAPATDVEMIVTLTDAEDGYQLVLTGELKGFSARLQTERQLVSASAAGYTVMTYRNDDAWVIDIIALEGLIPDGTAIALDFNGEGNLELTSVDGRDGWNQPVILSFENSLTENLPTVFSLAQNYPNPFNPVTTINYDLAATVPVRLLVYNSLGQQVATLVHDTQPAGRYSVSFDGSSLASGLYFYAIQAGEFNDLQKMMLVK